MRACVPQGCPGGLPTVARIHWLCSHARPASPAAAEFRVSLDLALGSATLSRAFLAVRRSEWAHFRGMPLEAEAAALYGRY